MPVTTADPTEQSPPYALWFRPAPKQRWRRVATASTHAEAVGLVGCGGRRGGDWIVLAASAPDPNLARRPT